MVGSDIDARLRTASLYRVLGEELLRGKNITAMERALEIDETPFVRIAVFDAQGQMIYAPARQMADPWLRDMAKGLATSNHVKIRTEEIVIAEPPDGMKDTGLIPVVMSLRSMQRQGGGILVMELDVDSLLAHYREASDLAHATIEVRRLDGALLARLPGARSASVNGAAIRDASASTRTERLPLRIVVTPDAEAILAGLSEQHKAYFLITSAISVAMLLVIAGLLHLLRQKRTLHDELASAEAKERELNELVKSEQARTFELASYDFLTGLLNRMMFHRLAAAELARARRSRKVYALYFLDLDKFKTINDTLGHAAGDQLLKAVAARLRGALREYDLVARLGGDEFVVLVSDLDSTEWVGRIAGKVVESLSAPYPDIGSEPVEVTPSIGIALYPGDGQDIDSLLSNADAAMYDAKRSGCGTYRFFDGALNTSSARKRELISCFRRAIRSREFCLHYQKRIGLVDMQPVGLEALVRWQHPAHGLLYPGEFIGLAEENDFIVALGHWVIEAACAQLAAWRKLGVPLLPVAINISAKQLRDEKLAGFVLDALARHTIPAKLLEIEVTESCFLERPDTAKRVLENLHEAGIKISLDDYGTGFSGLSHLKQLPISAVKIDRSFIRDIRNDTSDAMIVSSTISLSHNLGLRVVAEGVETKEQLVHLKAAGCDEVQGFFCHRPADAQSIAADLSKPVAQVA